MPSAYPIAHRPAEAPKKEIEVNDKSDDFNTLNYPGKKPVSEPPSYDEVVKSSTINDNEKEKVDTSVTNNQQTIVFIQTPDGKLIPSTNQQTIIVVKPSVTPEPNNSQEPNNNQKLNNNQEPNNNQESNSEQEISKTSTNNTPTIIVVKPSVTPEPNKPILGEPEIPKTPFLVKCPHCNTDVRTVIKYENNEIVYLLCIVLCIVSCIFSFIPFLINGIKDCVHYCPYCKREISRAKRI
ncbi:LITAF-like zinc ribbon domain-containing protein [Neocallimastix sp. 'constans']